MPPMPDLFAPYRLGELQLPSRILMAPMTRSRAGAGSVPTGLMATYYQELIYRRRRNCLPEFVNDLTGSSLS